MRGEGSPFAHFQVKSPDRNEVGRWAEIQVHINTPCYPRYLNFIQPPVVTGSVLIWRLMLVLPSQPSTLADRVCHV
jgi:hypothetical protein